jgi:prevent-host-death family protein
VATRGHRKISKRVLGLRATLPPAAAKVEKAALEWRRRTEVSVREAKDQLSALLQRAELGEEIVITSDGEPKAMLVRYKPTLGGKPWRSLAEFRATMPMTPDSTGPISESRDL